MSALQNIWILLTIENSELVNIFSLIFSTIEIYLYVLIVTALLNVKISRKKHLLFVVTLATIGILSSTFIPSPYYSFINFIFVFLFTALIFKLSFAKSAYTMLCFYCVSFFLSMIFLGIYSTIFHCPAKYFQNILFYKLISSASIYISLYMFYLICRKCFINITFLDKIKNHTILIINLFLGLITVLTQLFVASLYFNYLPIHLSLLSSGISLLYFLLSIFSLYRTNKLEITTKLLEEEKLYNKTLSTLHDNIRGFKHDFNNIIQAFGGYLSANNIDGLKTYYKDLLEDCQVNNNLSVLNPELINSPAIYSLLTDKYYKAERENVKINLEIFDDLSKLNIKIYELVRILGVLLDNAIEASSKSEEKVVTIIFRNNEKSNRHLIIIENTYINKDINIDKIFEKGYTSKTVEDKTSHGLGLWEVRKYMRKHENLNLYTTKNDTYFIQQFEIYNS